MSGTGLPSRYQGNATRHDCMRSLAALLMALAGLLAGFTVEAEDSSRINRVKAAFVLNIARFVSWPPEVLSHQRKRMELCLYRGNPSQEAFESIEGEAIAGRPVEIKHIQTLAQSDSCNILLIAPNELQHYLKEHHPDSNRPILTIADLTETDLPSSRHHDVLVTLIRNGARIGFEINLEKSRQAGLRMSSELLKLAIIVGDDT